MFNMSNISNMSKPKRKTTAVHSREHCARNATLPPNANYRTWYAHHAAAWIDPVTTLTPTLPSTRTLPLRPHATAAHGSTRPPRTTPFTVPYPLTRIVNISTPPLTLYTPRDTLLIQRSGPTLGHTGVGYSPTQTQTRNTKRKVMSL